MRMTEHGSSQICVRDQSVNIVHDNIIMISEVRPTYEGEEPSGIMAENVKVDIEETMECQTDCKIVRLETFTKQTGVHMHTFPQKNCMQFFRQLKSTCVKKLDIFVKSFFFFFLSLGID